LRTMAWLCLREHLADPTSVVPRTTLAVSLLSRLFHQEPGVVRHIFAFLGTCQSTFTWRSEELVRLTRSSAVNMVQAQTITTRAQTIAALVRRLTSDADGATHPV